jgi:hypothetical protein
MVKATCEHRHRFEDNIKMGLGKRYALLLVKLVVSSRCITLSKGVNDIL